MSQSVCSFQVVKHKWWGRLRLLSRKRWRQRGTSWFWRSFNAETSPTSSRAQTTYQVSVCMCVCVHTWVDTVPTPNLSGSQRRLSIITQGVFTVLTGSHSQFFFLSFCRSKLKTSESETHDGPAKSNKQKGRAPQQLTGGSSIWDLPSTLKG